MDRADIKLGFLLGYVLAAALHAGLAYCILRRRPRALEIRLFAAANIALAAWHLAHLTEYAFAVSRVAAGHGVLRLLQAVELSLALLVLTLFFHFFATFEGVYRRQAPSLRAAITTFVHRRARLLVPAAYLLLVLGGALLVSEAGFASRAMTGLRAAVGPTSAYLFGGTLLFMTFTLFPARAGQQRILIPSLTRALLMTSLAAMLVAIAVWHASHPRITNLALLPALHLHSLLFCVFLALVRYEFSFMDHYLRDGLRLLAWTTGAVVVYWVFNRIPLFETAWGRYALSMGRVGTLLVALAAGPALGRLVARLNDRLLFDRDVDLETAVHRFSERLARARTLQDVVDGAARDIARAVHAKSVRILVSRHTTADDVARLEREQGWRYRLHSPLGPQYARSGWLLLGERRNLYPYFDGERRYLRLVGELLGGAVEALRAHGEPETTSGAASNDGEADGQEAAPDLRAIDHLRASRRDSAAAEDSAARESDQGGERREGAEVHAAVVRARDEARAIRERFDPELVGEVLGVAEEVAGGDPRAALAILRRLRSTYDYLLANDVGPVTLGDEMEFAQDYLALEKLRLRNRLVVSLSFDQALADQEVPRRILQPLIENTLLHGLSRELRQGRIVIRAASEGGSCVVVIEDNGRGFPHGFDFAHADREGGLSRVHRWLQSSFGAQASLQIETPDEGARVRIVLPRRALAHAAKRFAAS